MLWELYVGGFGYATGTVARKAEMPTLLYGFLSIALPPYDVDLTIYRIYTASDKKCS